MKQFYETYYKNEKLSALLRELPQDTKNVFRDVYALDLLGLTEQHKEKDLQSSILSSLKAFIPEVGKDFCFMG